MSEEQRLLLRVRLLVGRCGVLVAEMQANFGRPSDKHYRSNRVRRSVVVPEEGDEQRDHQVHGMPLGILDVHHAIEQQAEVALLVCELPQTTVGTLNSTRYRTHGTSSLGQSSEATCELVDFCGTSEGHEFQFSHGNANFFCWFERGDGAIYVAHSSTYFSTVWADVFFVE